MDTKRSLNYEFLKDHILQCHNIADHDKHMLSHMLNACYCFSKLNFIDVAFEYIRDESMVISVYVLKDNDILEIAYYRSSKHPKCQFAICKILDGCRQPMGCTEFDPGVNNLMLYMFKNIPEEVFIKDETRDTIKEIADRLFKIVPSDYVKIPIKKLENKKPDENKQNNLI